MKSHMCVAFTAVALLHPGLSQSQDFHDTTVPASQIPSIIRDVAQWHDVQNATCRFKTALKSEVVERGDDYAEEHWTVEGCDGRTFSYKVTVFPEQNGGITDMVSNIDAAPHDSDKNAAIPTKAECNELRQKLKVSGDFDATSDDAIVEHVQLVADVAACDASESAP